MVPRKEKKEITDSLIKLLSHRMKKRRRSPSPKRDSGQVIRVRRSEIQSMVHAEVLSAVKQTEEKMERLLEKVQQLESEPKYDVTIHQLKARINKVKRRGDAAITFIQKLGVGGTQSILNAQSRLNTLALSWSDSEEETMETAPQSTLALESGPGQAMMNALPEIKKEPVSPSPVSSAATPPSSPQHKKSVELIKKELLSPVKSAECDVQEEAGLEVAGVKQEPPEEEDDDVFPPLPPTPFPSVLSEAAACYNVPQQPSLKLAVIRNPPGLSVLWNVEEVDPKEPPMDSYSVFMAIETDKGSRVFPEWKTLGEIPAVPLPMCVMLSKYKPGYKACFAVVGKDKFGRHGPYSRMVPARLPEDRV